MKVFIVHARAEPKSFSGALFQTAQPTLNAARTSLFFGLHPAGAALAEIILL